MTRIHINASTPYDVVIEEGALQRITDYIKPLKSNCRVIIVSDNNVAPHYLDSVKANMEHAGYVVCDYVSVSYTHLLADRYLVKGFNKEIFELPQERFMAIAMHLALVEGENKVEYAKKFYDLMSQLKMTTATPTLANAGTPFHQLSSRCV